MLHCSKFPSFSCIHQDPTKIKIMNGRHLGCTHNDPSANWGEYQTPARLQNTRPLNMRLQMLLPQSRTHQINIKTEYKHHKIIKYLSFFIYGGREWLGIGRSEIHQGTG